MPKTKKNKTHENVYFTVPQCRSWIFRIFRRFLGVGTISRWKPCFLPIVLIGFFDFCSKSVIFWKKSGKLEIEIFQHSIFEPKFAFKPFDDRSSFFAYASPRFCCHFLPSDQFGANPCKNGPKKCAPIHWKTRFFKPFDDLWSVLVCSPHRFCYNFSPTGDFRANSRKRPQKICANSSENQVFWAIRRFVVRFRLLAP